MSTALALASCPLGQAGQRSAGRAAGLPPSLQPARNRPAKNSQPHSRIGPKIRSRIRLSSPHLVVLVESVHLGEQLQQALLPLLRAAVGGAAAARLADRVDLVCGRVRVRAGRGGAGRQGWAGGALAHKLSLLQQNNNLSQYGEEAGQPHPLKKAGSGSCTQAHAPIKMMLGAFLRAVRNSERMRAAATPWNISTNSAPLAAGGARGRAGEGGGRCGLAQLAVLGHLRQPWRRWLQGKERQGRPAWVHTAGGLAQKVPPPTERNAGRTVH